METLSESLFGFDSVQVDDHAYLECTPQQIKYMKEVLRLVADDEFKERYVTDLSGFPDCRVFTRITELKVCIEVLARCPPNQIEFFETYKFQSHKEFENRIERYTKTKAKPNDILSRSRNWDVAINMFMKVEYFDPTKDIHPEQITLKREAGIYEYIWKNHVADGAELDEMTGIPMVFDHRSVTSSRCLFEPNTQHREIDLVGNIVPMTIVQNKHCSSLRYLTTEKLGPNSAYLLELCGSVPSGLQAFTFATAFKVFDQLLCRLLQLHRLQVIHNDVQPKHLHFGRLVCFDVLYLNSYKAATIIGHTSKIQRRQGSFLGSIRFGSFEIMKGYRKHPVHDIESAFYTLLSMLIPILPWDDASTSKESSNWHNTGGKEFDLQASDDEDTKSELCELKKKTIELKEALWSSESLFGKILASVHHYRQFVEEDKSTSRQAFATMILDGLYRRVRSILADYRKGEEAMEDYCGKLRVPSSSEYQAYLDLRRSALMFFNFEQMAPFLENPAYKKMRELREPGTLFGWDLSHWCFSHVALKANSDE